MSEKSKPSRLIGPEDVRVGDFVTIAHVTVELLPEIGSEPSHAPVEPVRVEMMPCGAGWPFEVVAMSLPFVLVKCPAGDTHAVDLRRHRLARVSRSYGKAAFASVAARTSPGA